MLDIALMFPSHERKTILDNNLIQKAQPFESSVEMKHLAIIWKMYVEPGFIYSCNTCYDRILKVYRQLQELFIQLHKDDQLLDSV